MKSWQEWSNTAAQWYQTNSGNTRWLVAVIGVSIIAVFLVSQRLFLSPATSRLFEGCQLSIDEMGAMQVAFGKAGLNEYEVEGSSISVPKSDRASYLKALADHGAIPPDMANLVQEESGLEFLQSRGQQRQRLLDRKKQNIREMVQQMSFVQKAIVDYDEAPGATPFVALQRAAIVTVKPVGSRILEFGEIKAIRDTVQGAVAGLMANDVTVIDINANRSWVGVPESESAISQPHATTRILEERKYENKIRSALSAYPGVRVNVEVAVDPVLKRVLDMRTLDADTVPVSQTVTREVLQKIPATGPSTTPGASTTVGANSQARIPFPRTDAEIHRQSSVIESISGSSYESVETAGLTVTDVRVSIGIPERCVDFFVSREQQQRAACNPDLADITLNHSVELTESIFDKIRHDVQQKVAPLIPGSADSNVRPNQLVVTIDPEIPLETRESPTIADTAIPWWFSWQAILVASIGLVVVITIRPLRRATHSSSDQNNAFLVPPEPQRTAADQDANQPHPPGGAADVHYAAFGSLRQRTEETMRHDLDRWCQENPDAAAATIRQWAKRQAG